MKQKKNLMILLLIAVICLVGVTIAYFSSRATFENVFETPEYGTEYIEKFTSPDNWLPGDVTEKTLEVRNSGTVDEAVRVKVEESWISNRGTTLPLKQGDNVAADIHWINDDDWTKVTVDGEDYYYYYYNYKLEPEETTSKLLDKVTFNPLINATTSCSDTVVDGVITRTCSSSGDGYDGATYTLKFTIETVQYNKYQEAWNTSINILPTKEIVVYGLHVNPKSATYETGDRHQMYIFEHEATEQTPALTDYRYIGDDPYNYVYFNCDEPVENQQYNYVTSCEVWRIIGVFDVEREVNDNENPGQKKTITEQRMKLVRSIFSTTMKWDSHIVNDWSKASLKTYLNEQYYNSLSISAQSQIEDAVYYLGGFTLDESYTTEQIYRYERGTTVYSDWPIKWQGGIALMYPSDMYMTYAKTNILRSCYNNPMSSSTCGSVNGPKSWIENSNGAGVWFLSPYVDDNRFVFYENTEYLRYNYAHNPNTNVRPVVYLSADVQIIDGDGSIDFPYILEKIQ